jgi:hypothetical protein
MYDQLRYALLGVFLTAKDRGLLIERTCYERKEGKLFQETKWRREPNGKGTG